MQVHSEEARQESMKRRRQGCISANTSPDHSSESESTPQSASSVAELPEHEHQAPTEKRLVTREQICREEYIARLESSLTNLTSMKANRTQLHQMFLHQYVDPDSHR